MVSKDRLDCLEPQGLEDSQVPREDLEWTEIKERLVPKERM